MILKMITEVLIMWILYAIYMAILVHGKGPVGGIFFYPMAMQDRIVELGLTTKDKIKRGMSIWRLGLRFLIFFWMVSIFDAVVLDWWMFNKTDIFGILIKKKTGRMPDVMRVDPQWDGKEFLKLFLEVIISVVLAWIFIKVR